MAGLLREARPAALVKLSVNVNKVATIRNSRGGAVPSVLDAVEVCLRAGAPGITVHPRGDARHITAEDTRRVGELVARWGGGAEFNIEGDPRPDLIDLVVAVRPTQCTLVPVMPGEITSQAGWGPDTPAAVTATVARLRSLGIRVSLFVDPEAEAIVALDGCGWHVSGTLARRRHGSQVRRSANCLQRWNRLTHRRHPWCAKRGRPRRPGSRRC